MTEPSAFVPQFILDAPAETDALNGRDRLASTIAETLIGDPRIKFVGLLGEWGSGKSTVVNLLERKLKSRNDADVLCFNYDVWLHQSDPPKRSFLEALVRFVREEPKLAPLREAAAGWEEELQALHLQVETSQVVTNPELAFSAKLILPTLFLVPLGVKLLGDGMLSLESQRDPAAATMFWIGWLLALGPAVMAAILYAAWRPWSDKSAPMFGKNSAQFWLKHRGTLAKQSILAVFANKPAEFKHEQKTKSSEPSTPQFQDMFRKIAAAVQADQRRLLIVIDNLDRVPDADRLALWSTVRSFFLGADYSGRPLTRDRLPTILVPVDASALDRLSGMKDSAPASIGDTLLQIAPASRSSNAQAFADKTFDLVFYVPPPVLSKWHAYLRHRLREVFGKQFKSEWRDTIPALYEAFARKKTLSPGLTPRLAPREMNVFVNAIAALWVQARGLEVPLETIAWFVLANVESTPDFNMVLADARGALVEPYDEDWRRGVAALYYGVSKADAQELFMEEPIRAAIRTVDTVSFQTLSGRPGFERYLLNVLQTPGAGPDGLDPQRAARLVSTLAIRSKVSPHQAAWRYIHRALAGAVAVHPLNVEGLGAALNAANPSEQRVLIAELAAALSLLAPAVVQGQTRAFAETIGLLRQTSDALGLSPTPISAPSIYVFLDLIMNDDAGLLKGWLNTRESPSALVSVLSAQISNNELDALDPARAIEALFRHTETDFNWTPVLEAVSEAAHSGNGWWIARSLRALWVLDQASGNPFLDTLIPLGSTGTLQRAQERMYAEGELEGFVVGLAAAFVLGMPLPGMTWSQVLIERPELGLDVAKLLASRKGVRPSNFRLRQQQRPQEIELIRAVFTAWLESSSLEAADLDEFFDNRLEYENLIEENVRPLFWNRLAVVDGFYEAFAKRGDTEFTAVARQLIAFRGQDAAATIKRASIAEQIQERLNAVSKEGWQHGLLSDSPAYELLSYSDTAVVPPAMVDALHAFVGQVIDSSESVQRMRWFEIVARLPTPERTAALEALKAAVLTASNAEHYAELFSLGSDALLSTFNFPSDADEFVSKILHRLVVLDEGRNWINQRRETIARWIDAASPGPRAPLIEMVERLRSQEGVAFELPL
ncbi:P-loop NTPase fold protein [Caulobacter sp. 602-1]|uniref:P-loop NTPase fold protein n=1 Tax=Caulobacter sp. 602-1 TaxID=2492472 RepID=UPI000F63C6B9|nr:P-loop NTPase fold protein [Caulobacter sp. 602-1]RRN64689.1 hypothetical protein EIK80_11685 [Caulobacter sp. 602-1]